MSSRNEGVSIVADFKDKAVPLGAAPVNGTAYTYKRLESKLRKLGIDFVKTVTDSPPLHLWFSPRTLKAMTVPDQGDVPLAAATLDRLCADFGFSRADLDNVS